MTNAGTFHPPKSEPSGILGHIPGVLLCLTCVAAIAFPVLGSVAVELTITIALLAAGLIGIVAYFRSGMQREMAVELIAALLGLIMGAVLLTDPLAELFR